MTGFLSEKMTDAIELLHDKSYHAIMSFVFKTFVAHRAVVYAWLNKNSVF